MSHLFGMVFVSLAWSADGAACDRGVAAYNSGRLEDAIADYEECLASCEDDNERAWVMTRLGRVVAESGHVSDAAQILEHAYAMQQTSTTAAPEDRADTAWWLADTYVDLERYDEATELLTWLIAIEEELFGATREDLGETLNLLALVEKRRGNHSEAEACYLRALEISVHHFGSASPDAAVVLVNLGALKKAQGDLLESRAYYERSLAAIDGCEQARCLRIRGFISNNLAALLSDLGDLGEAEHHQRMGLSLRRAAGAKAQDIAMSLQNLARTLTYTGREEEAQGLYEEALQLYVGALGAEHSEVATTSLNLGVLLQRMGNHEAAEDYWSQAAAIAEAIEAWVTLSAVEAHRGGAARERGDLDASVAHHRRALALRQHALGAHHVEVGEAHNSLAVALRDLGEAQEAVNHARLGESLVFDHVSAAAASASPRELVELVASRRTALDTAMRSETDPLRAWTRMMAWKGLARRMAVERHLALLGSDALAASLADLTSSRDALAAALSDASSEDAVRLLMEDKERLERDLAVALPDADRRAVTVDPLAICASLDHETVLIDLLRWDASGVGDMAYLAVVVDADCDVQRIPLGPAEAMDAAVADYVGWLQRGAPRRGRGLADPDVSTSTDAAGLAAARHLSEALLAPLAPMLADIKRVALVPDGSLARLPFAALQTDTGFLVDTHVVAVLDDANDAIRAPGTSIGVGALVVGDVDFGDTLSAAPETTRSSGCLPEAFAPLPGTAVEATRVARRLRRKGHVEEIRGSDATRETLEAAVQGRRWIHLATHGFYAPPTCGSASAGAHRFAPMAVSGIALAGDAQASGLWTAEEMASLDLRGTELVVLSACETGLGEVRDGDAVLGLRRALAVAGVKSMVVSLWSVPDAETQALMDRFYKHRPWKVGAAAALRKAQRDMLRTGRANARTWAAFAVLGPP